SPDKTRSSSAHPERTIRCAPAPSHAAYQTSRTLARRREWDSNPRWVAPRFVGLAEGVGFEPTETSSASTIFKIAAIVRSATLPRRDPLHFTRRVRPGLFHGGIGRI